ncbi:MAG: DegT/DnrJ/EryC1/StrS family aminotransferase [Limisphaerales bacterium]
MASAFSRRRFLKTTTTTATGMGLARSGYLAPLLGGGAVPVALAAESQRPALLGGSPVRQSSFPEWPVFDGLEEQALQSVLHSRKWFRGDGQRVTEFETAFASLMDSPHAIATANGTSALFASLGGLEVGPGDEVILPPYTFIATLNVILLQHALPIFVDTDPETFQIDARKMEAAVTDRTTALIPVHLGGNVADLDVIMEISRRRKLPVIEDACQAHLAEWRGRKVGTIGATGCFSFQASKNLNCGEGGAILIGDEELAERCYAFHNNCRGRRVGSYNFTYLGSRGANLRLTEFQAALLVAQMTRLEAQSRTREQNAGHLTRQLRDLPGILPAQPHAGCTRNAYHLYMFRYRKEHFADLPRARFIEALSAEGIPCSGGYSPLNRQEFMKATLKTRAYQRMYPADLLAQWEERTRCPANDQLCEEAVWFTQTMLLGPRQDMDDIANAIEKIHRHAAELAKG